MNNQENMEQKSNIIIYTTEDGLTKIETTFDEDTVWLSIDQMAELFQRDKSTISRHIKNIFSEGELVRESVVANFATTAADGKTYQVDYYNLDVIISVGYRVKSKRGTQFRIWALNVLKEYMRKGFALDDERLKNLGGGGYFKELLERIRDIRASEKVFYRQVLEIYATSIDYDPKAEISILFFKKVQNKIHFGKRIAVLRRKAGLSQTDLAEKLGVTSQAVSKWECGNAVPDIDTLLDLSHLYKVTINEMLGDIDLLCELTGRETGHSGIAYFAPEQERDDNIEWANEIQNGRWISRNWEQSRTVNSYMDGVGKQIASCDGIILEIGAGPGGGYMPYILKANPDATIIISDLSPTVVREWKTFLDKTVDSPNLYYAVFDFCSMPFKDNSIDIISDGGGIGNCEGEKSRALKEAFRVLKPGGKLVTSTGFVNKETLAAFPMEVQKLLLEKRPDVFEDLYEDTVLAGFSRIDSVISGCWYTDDDNSTIADLARSLGVNLKFTSYTRYAVKE